MLNRAVQTISQLLGKISNYLNSVAAEPIQQGQYPTFKSIDFPYHFWWPAVIKWHEIADLHQNFRKFSGVTPQTFTTGEGLPIGVHPPKLPHCCLTSLSLSTRHLLTGFFYTPNLTYS